MKLQLVCYGNHDNLHAKIKQFGRTFRLTMFFNTGDAYILASTNKHKPISEKQKKYFYNQLFLLLEEIDFQLKTPYNKILKHNFITTKKLLEYVRR